MLPLLSRRPASHGMPPGPGHLPGSTGLYMLLRFRLDISGIKFTMSGWKIIPIFGFTCKSVRKYTAEKTEFF